MEGRIGSSRRKRGWPRVGDLVAPDGPLRSRWPDRREPRYSGILPYDLPTGWLYDFAPRVVLLLAMALYAAYYGLASLGNYDAFWAPGFDIGIFDQGIWLLSRFKDPFVSVMGMDLFGDHASYILLALVPIYWIWPAPEALLIVQTLALAAGAIPVFLLGRQVMRSSWLALLPALGYLVTPALGWMNLENFHPDSFEVPLLLFALYFMFVRRWTPYIVMILLLLAVKEDVPFLVVPLGVYVALRYDRRMGLITAYAGALWFIVTWFFLGPLFSGTEPAGLDSYRVPFGGVGGLISAALREPWTVLAQILTADKIKYLMQMLVPVMFLPLFTASSLIIVPVLLLNLLSLHTYQSNMHYHYTSLTLAVFAAAALFAANRVSDLGARKVLAVGLLLAALFSAYVWGPVQGSRQSGYNFHPLTAESLALKEAATLIPADAVVSARPRLVTHFTHREKVYEFPTPFVASNWGSGAIDGQRLPEAAEVEYVLEIPKRLSEENLETFLTLQTEEGFREVFSKEGVVLLQRTAEPQPPG